MPQGGWKIGEVTFIAKFALLIIIIMKNLYLQFWKNGMEYFYRMLIINKSFPLSFGFILHFIFHSSIFFIKQYYLENLNDL